MSDITEEAIAGLICAQLFGEGLPEDHGPSSSFGQAMIAARAVLALIAPAIASRDAEIARLNADPDFIS